MQIIEGVVLGIGGNARRTWINIRADNGYEYRGTIPAGLRPRSILGREVRINASRVTPSGTRTFEYERPRWGEFLDADPETK